MSRFMAKNHYRLVAFNLFDKSFEGENEVSPCSTHTYRHFDDLWLVRGRIIYSGGLRCCFNEPWIRQLG